MNLKYLIMLIFCLASILFFAGNLKAQKLISGAKPSESQIDDFDKSFCVNFSGKIRVCKVARYGVEIDSDETNYIILKGDAILAKTDAPFHSLACCEMKDFFAYYGDLDKDGSKEIVVASLEGVGNGIAISSYNIIIFRDPEKFPSEKPLIFPLEEFGEKGNFIFDTKLNQTLVLVTNWSSFNNLDIKRGYGTYLVGKWFRYENGLLKPVLDKPTLARRFLFSFADERNKTWENPNRPYLWLKSRNTHKFFQEPKELSKLENTEYGIIKTYEKDDEIYQQRLIIETDSGNLLKGIYSYNSLSDKKEENTVYITDIGLSKSEFTFPFDFNPYIYFGDKFIEKRVKLETYQNEYGYRYTKLWFLTQ